MAEQDPTIQEPQYEFGPPKEEGGVTRADFARLEAMVQQNARPRVDPSSLTNDVEREIGAIVEQLEKQPVKGFQAHTDFIVNRVTEKVVERVGAALEEKLGKFQEAQQVDAYRESIVKRVGVGLNEAGNDFLRDFLADYDMNGLRGIAGHKKTLDGIRNAAENIHSKNKNVAPTGSGGVASNTGQPPANVTNEQEAEAQEMFKRLGHKGLTIEKARELVSGVENDPGMTDPANRVAMADGK